jgi:toxin ParE1/3/4
MPQAIRTRAARRDLAEIWHFIGVDNIDAADQQIDRFTGSFQLLANHPGIGPSRPALGRDVRTYPVGNYIVYYRTIAEGLEVLRVIHGARDVHEL